MIFLVEEGACSTLGRGEGPRLNSGAATAYFCCSSNSRHTAFFYKKACHTWIDGVTYNTPLNVSAGSLRPPTSKTFWLPCHPTSSARGDEVVTHASTTPV